MGVYNFQSIFKNTHNFEQLTSTVAFKAVLIQIPAKESFSGIDTTTNLDPFLPEGMV